MLFPRAQSPEFWSIGGWEMGFLNSERNPKIQKQIIKFTIHHCKNHPSEQHQEQLDIL
jgi:hypothetical protein